MSLAATTMTGTLGYTLRYRVTGQDPPDTRGLSSLPCLATGARWTEPAAREEALAQEIRGLHAQGYRVEQAILWRVCVGCGGSGRVLRRKHGWMSTTCKTCKGLNSSEDQETRNF